MQGTLTEHVEGGVIHQRAQGASWIEGKANARRAAGNGGNPVVVIAVGVFTQ